MRGLWLGLGLLWAATAGALDFPALSGRVVDTANLLDPATEQSLTDQLAAHERATTNQVMVVTVPSLGGVLIEDYGYQLGRHWGIGQKDKNNGVLLIVAPNDRATRIEVGYGLEGTLPDATAHRIVDGTLLPAFRSGDFQGGITAGVHTILGVLDGSAPPVAEDADWIAMLIFFLFFTVWLGVWAVALGWLFYKARQWARERNISYWVALAEISREARRNRGGGGGGGGGSSGGSSGGGFSGGGGSFGGGGSSGRW
jgi:uncharacterized protein